MCWYKNKTGLAAKKLAPLAIVFGCAVYGLSLLAFLCLTPDSFLLKVASLLGLKS